MSKKSANRESGRPGSEPPKAQSLGEFLANLRTTKKFTLREVEEATNKEVSNAYLSQLETGKITRPSPNVLHALAAVYGVRYETLMEKAGYLTAVSAAADVLRGGGTPARHGRVATFANADLTQEEEEKLLEYLAFLRSRRSRGEKG